MATAIGTYATRAKVQARLDSDVTYTAEDEELLDDLSDQINAWLESEMGRPICPRTGITTLTLDGYMAEDDGRVLPIPFGINSLTTLEVAAHTGAAFEAIASTDYFLRPVSIMRRVGWPALQIVMSDYQVGSVQPRIPVGYANVRLTGADGFLGWPAIPDELSEIATTAVVRAWQARSAGQADILGTDEYGRPVVSRYLSRRDLVVIDRYNVRPKVAGGGPMVMGN
jgi:hypothetical protein